MDKIGYLNSFNVYHTKSYQVMFQERNDRFHDNQVIKMNIIINETKLAICQLSYQKCITSGKHKLKDILQNSKHIVEV